MADQVEAFYGRQRPQAKDEFESREVTMTQKRAVKPFWLRHGTPQWFRGGAKCEHCGTVREILYLAAGVRRLCAECLVEYATDKTKIDNEEVSND